MANTLSDVAFLPMVIVSFPFSVIGEFLFSSSNDSQSETAEDDLSEKKGIVVQKEHRNIEQTIETACLPQVIAAAVEAIPGHSEKPVYINLNLNNQQAAASTIAHSNEPEGSEQKKDSLIGRTQSSLMNRSSRIFEWIVHNKRTFLVGCASLTYVGIQLYLWYLARTLSQESWSSWQKHCMLSDFYQRAREELVHHLMKDFETRFHGTSNHANAQNFLQEAKREIQVLRRYNTIVTRICRWPFTKLFFIDTALLESIPDRIQRTTFLHDTVHSWLVKHPEETHTPFFHQQNFNTLTN